jgi:hypothetical protein
MDEAGMGLGAMREPVPALLLGPAIAAGPAQRGPADRTRCTHPEPGRCLATRQALVNGGQNAGAKVKG